MGLLKSFKNGTQTDLRQKKFGKDRPGDGSSNQPYIQQSIDRTLVRGSSTDALLRGGLNAATTAVEDSNRLADLLFDRKSPQGFLFVSKQRLLSKISPKTPASFGSGYTGGALNQGVYSPLSTVEQAKRGFSGFHTERFGLFLGTGLNRYNDVVQGKSNNGIPSDSRIFGLQQALFTDNGAPEGTLDVFKVSDNNDTPVVLEYNGGPGSNTGEGNCYVVRKEFKKEFEDLKSSIKKGIIELKNYIYKTMNKSDNRFILKRIWEYYYINYIDIFADISYGYCITVHKSQGSTYKNVFIDSKNILEYNRKDYINYKCLYTAITRASNKVYMLV